MCAIEFVYHKDGGNAYQDVDDKADDRNPEDSYTCSDDGNGCDRIPVKKILKLMMLLQGGFVSFHVSFLWFCQVNNLGTGMYFTYNTLQFL